MTTLEEFDAEARHFVRGLTPHPDSATLVTLSGELGAGKTAFVKAAARELGVAEAVQSPTFVLEKIYPLGGRTAKFRRLVHIDAYRLERGSELAPLRLNELMADAAALIFLEWPEKVADALPKPSGAISITSQLDGTRLISYGS